MASVTVITANPSDVVLTTNAAPDLSVVYQEDGESDPTHSYSRANTQSGVVHLIAGRQAPVGFRPQIEGNADIHIRRLIVAIDPVGGQLASNQVDRIAFDPLVALVEYPQSPYVTMTDGRGRRWFSFPQWQTGDYTWKLHSHIATVSFTEVATVPAVLTVDVPAVP